MRILYLSPGCFDMGGISRYNRYQIKALREIVGKENVVVYSLLGKDVGGFKEVFEVDWSSNGIKYANKIHFAVKSLAKALTWKPDLIFCAHVNLSGLAHMIARLVGADSILNTYGLEVWSGLSKDAAWGLKNVDHVISDCHFTAQYLENEGLRKFRTTTVIWDCVDLNTFHQEKNLDLILKKYNIPAPANHFNILTLGRLSHSARHKGYERLIEVFKEVAKTESSAQLIFAGKGDFVDALKSLSLKTGVADRIIFTGRIDDEDLSRVYSSAHLFSLVSDRGKNRGEGIPLTPLEAMACETPIIVGNQDGSQEAIVDNKNGYAIDPFDLEHHTSIILEMIKNPLLLSHKKDEARKVAIDYFSYFKFKQKHIDFLEKVKSARS